MFRSMHQDMLDVRGSTFAKWLDLICHTSPHSTTNFLNFEEGGIIGKEED
jgi:hypothetical protein